MVHAVMPFQSVGHFLTHLQMYQDIGAGGNIAPDIFLQFLSLIRQASDDAGPGSIPYSEVDPFWVLQYIDFLGAKQLFSR